MHSISLHIAYLLRRHDCVIVPGLGAFIASETPARLGPDGVSAPCRTLAFNPAITHNDGILASSLARHLKISFDEASRQIAAESDRMQAALRTMRELSLPAIGTLERRDDGRLCFAPEPSVASVIGLAPVAYPQRRNVVPQEDDAPAVPAAPKPESAYWTIRVPKRAVNIAAAVAAFVLTLALSVVLPSDLSTPRADRAAIIPTHALEHALAEATKAPAPAQQKGIVPEASEPVAPVVEPETALQTASPRQEADYHLIVGTFSSAEQAQLFVRTHPEASLTVIEGARLYRVAIASASDEAALRAQMRTSGFSSAWPGAWIWHSPTR